MRAFSNQSPVQGVEQDLKGNGVDRTDQIQETEESQIHFKFMAMTAIFASAAGLSQAQTVDITGITVINDRIDDAQTAANKDIARGTDANRFGNPEFRPGLSGSASNSYFGQNGNNDSQDFTAGGRLRFASGPMVQTFGFAVDHADVAGVRSKQDVFGVYDANYYFNEKV
jgi:putative salt-induced outer membrane protein